MTFLLQISFSSKQILRRAKHNNVHVGKSKLKRRYPVVGEKQRGQVGEGGRKKERILFSGQQWILVHNCTAFTRVGCDRARTIVDILSLFPPSPIFSPPPLPTTISHSFRVARTYLVCVFFSSKIRRKDKLFLLFVVTESEKEKKTFTLRYLFFS